jgi:hypothetical protein
MAMNANQTVELNFTFLLSVKGSTISKEYYKHGIANYEGQQTIFKAPQYPWLYI